MDVTYLHIYVCVYICIYSVNDLISPTCLSMGLSRGLQLSFANRRTSAENTGSGQPIGAAEGGIRVFPVEP